MFGSVAGEHDLSGSEPAWPLAQLFPVRGQSHFYGFRSVWNGGGGRVMWTLQSTPGCSQWIMWELKHTFRSRLYISSLVVEI